jgi:DNA-binding transcriptional LysR family regulator
VVAVADERSFTRAAVRCHIAQSALSYQIARLEAELGTKLFERTSRSVSLTDAGAALLPYARQVQKDMAEARNAVDALTGLARGQLLLGMTQTAGRALNLITVLGDYHRRFPEIKLSAMTGPDYELVEAVRSGRLDLAVAALGTKALPDDVAFRPVGPGEPLVAVVSVEHRLATRKRVGLRELADNSTFVEFVPDTALRVQVDAAFATSGITRTSSFEVGQISDMVRFAANGLGTAIVPRAFTQGTDGVEPLSAIRVLRLAGPGLSLRIGVFLKRERTPAAARAFVALLDSSLAA